MRSRRWSTLERQDAFEQAGVHFESRYSSPSSGCRRRKTPRASKRWLYEGRAQSGVDPHELLRGFVDRTDRVLQLIEGFMPESAWLDDPATLTYLHSTISTRQQRVRVPETPMHLDALLADQPLAGRPGAAPGRRASPHALGDRIPDHDLSRHLR